MRKSITEILGIAFITIMCLAVVAVILHLIYHISFAPLPRGEIQKSCASPTGEYTVNLYLCNGGATVDYVIRGEVVFNDGGIPKRKKDIHWQYHESDADCAWITDHVVSINGMELDVRHDRYDFRYSK